MNTDDLEAMVHSIGATSAVSAEPAAAVAAVESTPLHAGLVRYVDPDKLQQDVAFNLSALDEGIREQAGKFVWYATQAAHARRQYETAKLHADVRSSELYSAYREKFAEEGKKVTEAALEAAVKVDPRYLAAQTRMIDARAIFDLANDSRNAFEQRKDMLIQVSVDRRKERDGELRIMGAQVGAMTTEQQRQALAAFAQVNGPNKAAA